ncbi:response regulator [Methanobacterium spitsbergense]|uniref:Response regulator n=1 Tax=Methanobacterium spitsbergense TaxID=2874285 RepID=A0A8T5V596_9EURY|nr:response regulator [Methanobacterium spitsbergense]MBZ2166835.1 response regulator [Methanobacterium spitsbergense]
MKKQIIKILLIEDNPGDTKSIIEMLKEADDNRYEVVHTTRLDDGIKIIVRDDFDLILLDLGLPDSEGMDTFNIMKYNAPDIPIIVLTGLKEDIFAVSTVGRGAQDYLVKDEIDSKLLATSIDNAMNSKK